MISQCMIVKNEEKNIEKALSWGKGIVSEQIVVDTGSTDRTVEIAKKMGAKVYDFAWIDDFAAAKNYAIEQAQYEWIAFLDADEYFLPEDAGKLPALLDEIQDTVYNGVATGWLHLDAKGNVTQADTQIRIFRNLPGLRYERRIHEYLSLDHIPIRVIEKVNDLAIYHTGYAEAAQKKKMASRRNLNLLLAEVKDHPDDYEAWGYLGNEYDAMEMFSQAKEAFQKAISLMPEVLVEGRHGAAALTFLRLLNLLAFREKGSEEELLAVYNQAIRHMPKEGDYDYLIGEYYATNGNYQKAEYHLRRALKILDTYGNMVLSAVVSGKIMKAYELLAICCFNNQNLADCVKFTTALLKENPYLMSTLVLLVSAFGRDESTTKAGVSGAAQVAAFLGSNFYNFQSLKDRLFVLRASMAAGYEALTSVMRGTFTAQELVAVDKSLSAESQENVLPAAEKARRKLRIVLFYSEVESFNFFTDQLDGEFRKRGHKTYIFDLRMPSEENVHSRTHFEHFLSEGVDMAVCFDALGIREDLYPGINQLWDQHQAAVMDIFMDAPTRFFPAFMAPPQHYYMFCCDRDHVDYMEKYYGKTVKNVVFMPHAGVMPAEDTEAVPYKERKYDILFCGTYYRPEDKFADLKQELAQAFPGDTAMYQFYEYMYQNLKEDSSLSMEKAALVTASRIGWTIPEDFMEALMYCGESIDWAVRMYQRERVIAALADAGFEVHLLGRGWENHPCAGRANVHRIDDRIPYGQTLSYMADAKITLNVMPWFKNGTHDRIFNAMLQRSIPLTDASGWIREHFTDGTDIALYDLEHLDRLPEIAARLLEDESYAASMIEAGYKKAAESFTWSDCAERLLEAFDASDAG